MFGSSDFRALSFCCSMDSLWVRTSETKFLWLRPRDLTQKLLLIAMITSAVACLARICLMFFRKIN